MARLLTAAHGSFEPSPNGISAFEALHDIHTRHNTACDLRYQASTKMHGADRTNRCAGGDPPALCTIIHYDRRDGKEANERKNGSGK
jgi:hypothetical protein